MASVIDKVAEFWMKQRGWEIIPDPDCSFKARKTSDGEVLNVHVFLAMYEFSDAVTANRWPALSYSYVEIHPERQIKKHPSLVIYFSMDGKYAVIKLLRSGSDGCTRYSKSGQTIKFEANLRDVHETKFF